ncbi:hypothetical protein [Symmachiella dynata]|uniref:hypothetical protein n=1 Tax=Symmachiella dynata TaxID=2527995 RepID=UPI0030EB3890
MNRKVIVLVGIVAFGLVGLAAYQAAAAIVRSDREAILSVDRMSQLTSTQHGRLEKDFQSFYRKPAEEQQKLREMHAYLQQRGKAERLKQISQNYYAWYSEVGSRRRIELREQTNVQDKLALVLAIQKTMEEEQQANGENSWGREGRGRSRRLSSQDLANVMELVEIKLREEDPAASEQLDEIEDSVGYRRYYSVMSILLKASGDNSRGPDMKSRKRLWDFFEDERFLEVITNRGIRRMLEKRGDRERSAPRPSLIWILGDSLREAYHEEIKPDLPDEKELMEYFVQLSDVEQGKLIWYSTDDFMRHLSRKFVHEHEDRYPKDPTELFRSRGPRDRGRRGGLKGAPGRPKDRRQPPPGSRRRPSGEGPRDRN